MHYSFDFWNTLAQSNPDGAVARGHLIHHLYDIPLDETGAVYRRAKTLIDGVSEESGVQIPHDVTMNIIIGMLGADAHLIMSGHKLTDLMVSLFQQYPPIIASDTIDVLRGLVADGHTISIGSNTNVIRGREIAAIVTPLVKFDFLYFSDEGSYAKPSPVFFQKIFENAREVNSSIREKSDIIHVGDSQKCDIEGGNRAGFKTIKITNAVTFAEEMNNALREIF